MIPRPMTRWLAAGLFLSGLLLAGKWLVTDWKARAFQSAESKKLETALRQAEPTSRAEPGPPGPIRESGPSASNYALQQATLGKGVLGRIEIPRLRISAMIAEGTDPAALEHAVGHIPSTSQPGEPGNVGLAGHRDTFFRGLGGVREDDLIRIVTLEGTYDYQAKWGAVVEPHRVDVLDSTATRSLTLVTCYPFHWVGSAPKRFVVRAEQVETMAQVVH